MSMKHGTFTKSSTQRPGLCAGWEFCVPFVRLAVTFILLRPNYKRSLEFLLLNGYCLSPT